MTTQEDQLKSEIARLECFRESLGEGHPAIEWTNIEIAILKNRLSQNEGSVS